MNSPKSNTSLILRTSLSLAAISVIATAAAWWYLKRTTDLPNSTTSDKANRDPRISYSGPYRNIHPDIAFVGTEKCATCHADIARTYAQHPMGMSVFPIDNRPFGELANPGHASFAALGSQFHIQRAGDRLSFRETRLGPGGERLFEIATTIDFAIGSGNKGLSFLTDRDGFVNQSPMSWFSQKHIWDASPGFPPDLHAGRPIQFECLFCHANAVVPVPGAANRYEEPLFRNGHAIGCERCHGPGGEHVRVREEKSVLTAPDYSIVNPRRLEPRLREAVCQQCHLEGEVRVAKAGRSPGDFRPGLPLDAAIRVMVRDRRGEDRKAVNHVEQMYRSKCFQGSGGAMGCTTCHDPHEKAPPEKRAEQYRTACLKCHDCSSPREARAKLGSPDNCTACHMPQFAATDIVHAATTNHLIVRTSEPSKPKASSPREVVRPLAFFPAQPPDFRSLDDARDYAIGSVEMAQEGKANPSDVAREALPLLERAIAESTDDYAAWDAKSYALQFAGRKAEALAAAQQVLALAPNYERGTIQAAMLAGELNRGDLALKYWNSAVEMNPQQAAYRQELANAFAGQGDWSAAQNEAREAIALDPARTTARTILAIALFRAGSTAEADQQFHTVELLAPANLDRLRQRYTSERNRP